MPAKRRNTDPVPARAKKPRVAKTVASKATPKKPKKQPARKQPARPRRSQDDDDSTSEGSASPGGRTNVATRSMTLLKRTKFPFLRLPAELRNMVYGFALDFEGAARTLNEHYEAHVKDGEILQWPALKTPSVLVASRQMHLEAKFILHRKTLSLPHSTTPNTQITDVISTSLLENLRKVDITRDLSYGELHTWCDLLEFFALIKSAVKIWTGAHKLQELTIDMQGKNVVAHLQQCPSLGHCYFLDEIEKLMASLQSLRGIKKVTFGGFLVGYADKAKMWMQTPPAYFLTKLPKHLRERIYRHVLDWNDANTALEKASLTAETKRNLEKNTRTWPSTKINPLMSTPDILLVNKQITAEAISSLHQHKLTITAPPPRHAQMTSRISNFITTSVLHEVRHLALDISSRGSTHIASDWRHLIASLANVFKYKHSLRTLHINIRDAAWVEEQLKKDGARRAVAEPNDDDFYGLKTLGDLTAKRMCGTMLDRLTFGDGVAKEARLFLLERLSGGKSKRWNEIIMKESWKGLVADE